MPKAKKDIVVVAGYCVDNNWYGDRYRHILSETAGVGFTSMTAAKRFSARLKKVIGDRLPKTRPLSDKPYLSGDLYIEIGERETFVDYMYVSAGPSLSYKHIDLDVEELLVRVEKMKQEKIERERWG